MRASDVTYKPTGVEIFRLMSLAISFTVYKGGHIEMSSILADQ